MNYVERILDEYLRDMLDALPAIAIDGPKGVGKTETAKRLAKSVIELDSEAELAALRENPNRVSQLAHPLLIDEWQLFPAVWDVVRRAVDRDASPGRFILTGSATPLNSPKHSGAGRIVHVRMRPFSLAERLGESKISLAALLTGNKDDLSGESKLRASDYASEIVRGGLPALRQIPDRFRSVAWNGYLDEVLNKELPELGRPVRRRETMRSWLRSYAQATSTITSYTQILDNATPQDSDKPTKVTTLAWREALLNMWLLDPIPAWNDPLHKVSRLGKTPKHHLADPAIAAHLLGISAATLLETPNPDRPSVPRKGTLFGNLFESLVTMSIRTYAEVSGATASHLRTKDGTHEIDLILTRNDGKSLAIEIKSAPDVSDSDVRHLHWLKKLLGQDLLDAVVINTGPSAYRRKDQVAVIPAALLSS